MVDYRYIIRYSKFMPEFKRAKIIKHENPSTTFHRLWLQPEEKLEYHAGQFIAVKVAEKKINDYSIASAPKSDGQFELIIDIKPGHEGSYFTHELREGDYIDFMGPMGHFQFHKDDGAEELVFKATGSGLAPIKAMIEQLLWYDKEQRQMRLFFGLRDCDDIFMHQYFAEFDQDYENFDFVPCMSKPDEFWHGKCGHITDLLKEYYQDGSKLGVYMCGNPRMVQEAAGILKEIGTPKERIYYEAF